MKRFGLWSVIQSKPNLANVASDRLLEQGFSIYNPKYSERLGRGRGFRRVQLFTNYMFVEIVDKWRAVASTRGVHSVLTASGSPAFVPKGFVETLKGCENENGVVELDGFEKPKAKRFVRGQAVVVKSFGEGEVFEGFSAIFEKRDGRGRATVLLSLLGRKHSVNVFEGDLVAA